MLDLWMLADYFWNTYNFFMDNLEYRLTMKKAFANIVKKKYETFSTLYVFIKPIINTLPHYNLLVDPKKIYLYRYL